MAFDLKALLGENFREDMTIEELLEASKSIDYVDPSNVVSKDDYLKVKNANDSLSKESKEWKNKYNSTLSEQEQTKIAQEEALNQYKTRIAELERVNNVANYTTELLSAGYSDKHAKLGAEALADGDMATFLSVQKKAMESVRKDERANLLKQTPQPDGGEDNNAVMTKEKYTSMSLDEMTKYYNEHKAEVESMLSK